MSQAHDVPADAQIDDPHVGHRRSADGDRPAFFEANEHFLAHSGPSRAIRLAHNVREGEVIRHPRNDWLCFSRFVNV
jgi:hypothetical protein